MNKHEILEELEGVKCNYKSNYALTETGFKEGIDYAINLVKKLKPNELKGVSNNEQDENKITAHRCECVEPDRVDVILCRKCDGYLE